MRRKEREISDKALIESVIRKSDVCRVAFADNNIPYIVTLNFGYSGGEKPGLYFHCAPEGRKLEMMKKNSHVCFQMDTDHHLTKGDKGCDWGMKYKSIIGYGKLSVVGNEEGRKKGLDLIMDQYGGSGKYDYDPKVFSRTIILFLEITEITAKEA
jgi:nitroimidazol reductase NimA-like FMN-containing flavoprotein (pyridoxamine 5'-phosphate oxidase superfamily)